MLNVIPLLFSIVRHEGLKMQFITFSSFSPPPLLNECKLHTQYW